MCISTTLSCSLYLFYRKTGLVGGPTNRGLQGGVSKQQTGARGKFVFQILKPVTVINVVVGGNTRTKNYTRGGTTSESRDTQQDNFRTNAKGEKVNIIPKPLFVNRKTEKAAAAAIKEEGKRKFFKF